MMTTDEIVEEICRAFAIGEASWTDSDYDRTSTVTFYLAAIRLAELSPFPDQEVHRRVMEFLEKKLDEGTGMLLSDTMRQIRKTLDKLGGN